jgi:hypothetical protein
MDRDLCTLPEPTVTGEQGWLAPLPGALLAAALVTGSLFVRAERRHPHPLLPLTLFRSRELSGATGVGMIFNLVLYGTLLPGRHRPGPRCPRGPLTEATMQGS